MASGATQVHQTATSKNDYTVSIGEHESVNLILNVFNLNTWVRLEASHVDLVVEVANVADDSVVFHLGHVGGHDDVFVACGSDIDISSWEHR